MDPHLLAAVLAEPESDDPRLVLADWLEENGEQERGEFVRVQIELSRLDAACRCGWVDPPGRTCDACHDAHGLHRREMELLGENVSSTKNLVWPRFYRWCQESGIDPAWVRVPGFGVGADEHDQNSFRRGFVAAVSCRCVDWCGGVCPKCNGGKSVPELYACAVCLAANDLSDYAERRCRFCGSDYVRKWRSETCPDCHGTGRVGGHGPAVVRVQPVERVTLTDRLPFVPPANSVGVWGKWHWQRQSDRDRAYPHDPSERNAPWGIPDEVAAFLPLRTGGWTDHDTEADALDALSAAALVWAKNVAHSIPATTPQ